MNLRNNNSKEILTNFINGEKKYIVYADVCGVAKKDIEVKIKGKVLMITAKRELNTSNEGYHSSFEIKDGNLFKVIELEHDIDVQNSIAEYNNGLLKIIILKKEIENETNIININ